MNKGRAVGGPRDGIMLTAGADWDGRIKLPTAHGHSKALESYYPGYYAWVRGVWRWRESYRPRQIW